MNIYNSVVPFNYNSLSQDDWYNSLKEKSFWLPLTPQFLHLYSGIHIIRLITTAESEILEMSRKVLICK